MVIRENRVGGRGWEGFVRRCRLYSDLKELNMGVFEIVGGGFFG